MTAPMFDQKSEQNLGVMTPNEPTLGGAVNVPMLVVKSSLSAEKFALIATAGGLGTLEDDFVRRGGSANQGPLSA